MDLPLTPELALIHQPARLRIMGLLYKHRDVAFTRARDLLELTDGNLASHAGKLEAAGYLAARRVLTRQGFELRYRITRKGSDAFRSYLRAMRLFLAGVADGDGHGHRPRDGGTDPEKSGPDASRDEPDNGTPAGTMAGAVAGDGVHAPTGRPPNDPRARPRTFG